MKKRKTAKAFALTILCGLLIEGSALVGPAFAASDVFNPSWTIDQAVEHMQRNWMGGTVKKAEMTGEVRDFYMHFEEFDHEITDGVTVKAWGFGLEGRPATVPGPTIRVKKGDLVRIHLRNNSTQPHSLHSHGITSLDELNDGVPHVTGNYIMPGETFTYEYVVNEEGTHWYHCHVQTSLHQDMGMYGALIVEDTEKPAWDKEFVNIIDEWDTHRDPTDAAKKPNYNYFVVNGKAGNSVPDMNIQDGEVARVRLINAGFQSHALHLHGTHFMITHKDGYQLPQPMSADTLNIAPGETYDLLVKGRDGVFPWHDHNSLAVTDDGVYPGGMIMHTRGSEAVKFDPEQKSNQIPLEGHIHNSDEHVLAVNGDRQFLKEKMEYNSAAWASATPEERHTLHEKNMQLGEMIGGVYDEAAGEWTFPESITNSHGHPVESAPATTPEAPVNHPPVANQRGIFDAKPPVVADNAVIPEKTVATTVPFDPKAPAQPEEGKVVEVKLEAKRAMMEVAPGDTREVWTFNGSVPAPTIRVHQGDTLRITLENKDPDMEHGLDFHAGQLDMGVYHKPIKPGQSETFEFKTNYPGIFYFHCSANPVIAHIANGMFGAVIVDPPGYKPSGKEYVLIQNEWYKAEADLQELIEGKPVAVAFNGKAMQYMDQPLTAESGQNVRFYFVNAGINDFAAWHIIGQIFDAVYPDGNPLNKRSGVQTLLIPPGGAAITDLKAPVDGTYAMLTHQMNDAMKGALGILKVGAGQSNEAQHN